MSEEKVEEVEVKPFWKSTSFWLSIATVVGILLDKLVADGVIPNEGWAAIVVTVLGLVTKRGLTENAAMKANTLAKIANGKPKDPS